MSDISRFEPLWGTWRVVEPIGHGAFGSVYKITREERGATYYSALKHISIPVDGQQIKDVIDTGVDSSEEGLKTYFDGVVSDVQNEINLMYSLRGYSNIVAYEDHLIVPEYDIRMGEGICSNGFMFASGSISEDKIAKLYDIQENDPFFGEFCEWIYD